MRVLLFSLLILGILVPQKVEASAVAEAMQIYSQFRTYWKERKYCQICRHDILNGRQCGELFSTIAQATVKTDKVLSTTEQADKISKENKGRTAIGKKAQEKAQEVKMKIGEVAEATRKKAEERGFKLTKEFVAKSLLNPARWDSKFLYEGSGYTLNIENNAKEVLEGEEELGFEESMERVMEKIESSPKSNQTLLKRITGSIKGIFGRALPKKHIGWLCKTHCQAKTKFPLKIGDDLFKLEIKERYGQRQCMRFYHQYPRVHNQAVKSERSRVGNNIISVPVYTEHEGKFASRLIEQIIEDTTLVESKKKFKLYFPTESDEAYNEQNRFQMTVIQRAENRLRRNLAALVALRDRNILDVYRPMIGTNGLPKEIVDIIGTRLSLDKIDPNTVLRHSKRMRLMPAPPPGNAEGAAIVDPAAQPAAGVQIGSSAGATAILPLPKSQLRRGSRNVLQPAMRDTAEDIGENQSETGDSTDAPAEGSSGDTSVDITTGDDNSNLRDSGEASEQDGSDYDVEL